MATKQYKPSFEDKIRNIIEREAAQHIKDAPTLIRKMIEGSLLSLLGLEKKYNNNYEIDHCNNRNSVLIDAFRNQAIAESERIARGFKPTKEQLANYELAFKKEFEAQLFYAIKKAATARAQLEADALIATIDAEVKAALSEKLA